MNDEPEFLDEIVELEDQVDQLKADLAAARAEVERLKAAILRHIGPERHVTGIHEADERLRAALDATPVDPARPAQA